MKLLTLNTHSLQEENGEQKLEWFIEGVLQERPDIIALQEVSQTAVEELAESALWEGQYLIPTQVPLRRDNYGAQVAYRLRQANMDCYWVWLPIKRGYGKYDEGVALLSLGRKIIAAEVVPISRTEDYHNWRRRAALGIQVEGWTDWFYAIHTGWWADAEDPFREQWDRLEEHLLEKRKQNRVWLMGDFNAPDCVPGESYGYIRSRGWVDTYHAALQKDNGVTVSGEIDGWREGVQVNTSMRLDHIFCSHQVEPDTSCVIFNGKNRPVVSDHFGVLIQIKEETK